MPITGLMERVRKIGRHRGQSGQALVEYSLLLALVSVVAIAVLGGFGAHVQSLFLSIIASLATAGHGF
jgi:Flp pilus assembly pilin Flp